MNELTILRAMYKAISRMSGVWEYSTDLEDAKQQAMENASELSGIMDMTKLMLENLESVENE